MNTGMRRETGADMLGDAGVTFERFDGMAQSPDGIWDAPSGGRIAGFRDPDGNLLSLTQHA